MVRVWVSGLPWLGLGLGFGFGLGFGLGLGLTVWAGRLPIARRLPACTMRVQVPLGLGAVAALALA